LLSIHNEKAKQTKWIVYSAFCLGYLIITKFIFAYVTIAVIALIIIAHITFRKFELDKYIKILTLGFLLTIPYLFYTYTLTGKLFYWSSMSGVGLYWLTTSYENEWGSWLGFSDQSTDINPQHAVIKETIRGLSYIERNDIILNQAKENIRKNPEIYIKNVAVNTLRLFFGYPKSYTYQKPFGLLYAYSKHVYLFHFSILYISVG
jgi:hypothetical protein